MPSFPFDKVPANIFKGHGRNHAWFVFVQLRADAELAIKSWVHTHMLPLLSSAAQQIQDSAARKQAPNYDGGLVAAMALSASGYRKLGIPKEHWPQDLAFRDGMKKRGASLKDPPPEQWEAGYQQELDVVLLLADNSLERLQEQHAQVAESIEKTEMGKLLFTEHGKVLDPGGPCREHFGFIDSISQPEFWNFHGRFHETAWKLALVRHPNSPHKYGSYLVFRKLEQNVKLFNQQTRAIAQQIDAPNALQLAEAQTMGRFKNGTPLTLSDGTLTHDFTYLKNTDVEGSKCPFHAHMRKANPRNKGYKAKQLTRRGIPYGQRKTDLSDEPEHGVGLLFLSYQAVISNFEEVQIQCNDPGSSGEFTTIDPIIGQRLPHDPELPHAWLKKWHDPNTFSFRFQEVVTLKGGEYFFSPPLTYLKNILAH